MLPKNWATFGAVLKNATLYVKSYVVIFGSIFWQNWAISYAVALLKMDQFCLMLYDDCFAHSIVVKNKLLFRKREGRYLNEQKGA